MKDLLSTTSCCITTSSISGDGTYIDNDSLSTMATSTATYLSACPANAAMIQAQSYVESMSVEQLVEFDQRLAAMENEFEIPQQQEQPKEFVKTL